MEDNFNNENKEEMNTQPTVSDEVEKKETAEEAHEHAKADDGECPGCREYKKDKKIKNLISVAILLAGLFVGSLFVDVNQAVKGSGYSQKNLDQSQIFEAYGKTWVAYSEPAVPVTVISDDQCEKCDPSEAIVWLKRVLPTVSTEKVNYDSEKGKQLIDEFGLKTLPAFIFDQDVDKTNFYTQASVLFSGKDGKYVLDTNQLGLPAGKYLVTPKVNEGDAVSGPADAKVKVVVFSDFQCPYCKVFYASLRDTMKAYPDNVLFDFKELPLDIHPQADSAALASKCAQEQGKFWEYADKLYTTQTEWGAATTAAPFKTYAAALGLNSAQFNQCLDSKKYQNELDASKQEATDLGISGTPAIFVNDQFEAGAVTADQLKADIDAQMNK